MSSIKHIILILSLVFITIIASSQNQHIALAKGARILDDTNSYSILLNYCSSSVNVQLIEESQNNYVKINYSGLIGYVHKDYVMSYVAGKQYKSTILAEGAEIFNEPTSNSTLLNYCSSSVKVRLIAESKNKYFKIDYNGTIGYVYENQILSLGHSPVDYAKSENSFFSDMSNTNVDPKDFIKKSVSKKIEVWQIKGEFEKTEDYLNRIKNRDQYITQYIDSAKLALNDIYFKNTDWSKRSISIYDADSESFQLYFDKYGPLVTKVDIDEAAELKKEFNTLCIENAEFGYVNNKWSLTKFKVYSNDQYHYATYDATALATYQPANIAYNFDKPDIVIESVHKGLSSKEKTIPVISVGKSDVDIAIPISDWQKTNTFALIIGNEDYSTYQKGLAKEVNVDYAVNDAEVFSKYINQTLGVPMENITLLINATGNQIEQAVDKLSKLAKHSAGNAEIIFYYAGHGLPHQQTKSPYLIPVDVSGVNIEYGVELNNVYTKLTMYPSKRVLVFLDACFSGGARNNPLIASRGITVTPKENYLKGNLLVFASCSGNQVSSSWEDNQHGLFTYFLLKKIKETKGDLYLSELYNYLKQSVPLKAIKINKPEQEPILKTSFQIENVWHNWKLK